MLYDWFVNIILLSFCIVDTKFYKVRNDMIIFTLVAYEIYLLISYSINQNKIYDFICPLVIFFVSQVILSILSMMVTISYGDIKLIGLILAVLGINDGLYAIFFGSCFSLFPIHKKVANKIPMGRSFYIGYLIHLFVKEVFL